MDDPQIHGFDGTLFSAVPKGEGILLIHFKNHALVYSADLEAKEQFLRFLDRADADPSLKVLVLVGFEESGVEAYEEFEQKLASGELQAIAAERLTHALHQLISRILSMHKVFISVERNGVLASMFNVAMACDYRIMAEDACIQNPYVAQGMIPQGGGCVFLTRRMGRGHTLRFLLTSRETPAREALERGLVDEVVPTEQIEAVAMERAREFAGASLACIAGAKRLINHAFSNLEEHFELERQVIKATRATGP